MWRSRRRLEQLETEIARGKAERAELRRRLDWFETIAAAAGAAPPGTDLQGTALLTSGPPNTTPSGTSPPRSGQLSAAPSAPPPPNLVAAARDLRSHDVPVRLEVAGAEVVAIVGGPGDPHEWWTAIRQTVGRDAGAETADAEVAPA